MRKAVRCVFTCLLLAPAVADAAEVLGSSVTQSGNFYRASVSIRIDAPLAVVYAAITDYAHLAAINPSIVESRVLASPGPDRDRVYSAVEVCILIFCKRVVHVQDVERQDNGSILAITRPAESDFRSVPTETFSSAAISRSGGNRSPSIRRPAAMSRIRTSW